MATSNALIRPLNITIVGAGIAGLTAAVALRKNGHLVQIFETSEIAALGVQPNSLRVLNHLGVSRENLNGVPFLGNIIFDSKSGEGMTRRWLVPGPNENPGLLCHRSDLHTELKRLAISVGEGVPAKLRLGTEVLGCNPEEGSITLNNGEVVYADLVLGADGINVGQFNLSHLDVTNQRTSQSIIRDNILGHNIRGSPSGWSCFRAVFETDTLGEIPELQWVTEGISGARSVVPKEGPFRMLFVYPCRGGNLINLVGFYTDSQEPVEVRKPIASREDIKAVFRDFNPKFLRLLDLPTHSEIHRWRMRALPLLPTWINRRAALLGDAAHATLPLLGQGAAMAVEDAGALGCLLPAGTTRDDVQVRLAVYQNLRKDRGEFVNINSVEQVSRIMNGGLHFARSQEMQSYLLEYDVIEAARKCYEEGFGHNVLA